MKQLHRQSHTFDVFDSAIGESTVQNDRGQPTFPFFFFFCLFAFILLCFKTFRPSCTVDNCALKKKKEKKKDQNKRRRK